MSDPAAVSPEACPTCGEAVDADAWSCTGCGAPLVPKSPPRARPHHGAGGSGAERHGQAHSAGERPQAAQSSPGRVPPAILVTAAGAILLLLGVAYAMGAWSR